MRRSSSSQPLGSAEPISCTITPNGMPFLTKVQSPSAHQVNGTLDFSPVLLNKNVIQKLEYEFKKGPAYGILFLATQALDTHLPPILAYWREFGKYFLTQLCNTTAVPWISDVNSSLTFKTSDSQSLEVPIFHEELNRFIATVPPVQGAEYVTDESLENLWNELKAALVETLKDYKGSLQTYFESLNSVWNVMGRVCFHLAENKEDPDTPFAFLATYTHHVSAQAKAQHLPLGRAMQEYSGAGNKQKLLSLLLPVQKAAALSPFLKRLVDSGDIFHPLAWTPSEAYRFLLDTPHFEASGLVVRVPDWWNARKPTRPFVSVQIGKKKSSNLGPEALLDFSIDLSLEGEKLTPLELEEALSTSQGLFKLRGKWVEIDSEKLQEALDHWKKVEEIAKSDGLTFFDGMRLLSGISIESGDDSDTSTLTPEWSQVSAGKWLENILKNLRSPESSSKIVSTLKESLLAELRPYQKTGVEWLWHLDQLGFGGCLADDMGLGKTIQVISLLLLKKKSRNSNSYPNLLIVPASLIGNWKSEIEKFAPSLNFFIAHTSGNLKSNNLPPKNMEEYDLIITTYGSGYRLPWLKEIKWESIILDEAQIIKNPNTKQTRSIKVLKTRNRLALTGTPIENHLSDLWSLFDFICPGLLGSPKSFGKLIKKAEDENQNQSFASIRTLVRPYILRRVKTDKQIILDLPDKTEVKAYCGLSPLQAALYQEAVEDLSDQLARAKGIARLGLIFSFMMRLKQICNHPSQWLSAGKFNPAESGKFHRLREICEEIAEKQEKALIFTQFREMTGPLSEFLAEVFGKPGLILHGGTSVKKRKEMVDLFQNEISYPFFILSLKAGGVGLNLTAASHVIHFDRWWNPAVENQATDRAFRIGQKKNVLVHKFVCRGTIEERIDSMIESKQSLSKDILEGSHETLLTQLPDQELLKLVALDYKSALEEDSNG